MKSIVSAVENNPKHLLHGLLGTLTQDAFRPQF